MTIQDQKLFCFPVTMCTPCQATQVTQYTLTVFQISSRRQSTQVTSNGKFWSTRNDLILRNLMKSRLNVFQCSLTNNSMRKNPIGLITKCSFKSFKMKQTFCNMVKKHRVSSHGYKKVNLCPVLGQITPPKMSSASTSSQVQNLIQISEQEWYSGKPMTY